MFEKINDFFIGTFGLVFGLIFYGGGFFVFGIGTIYWIWMSIQLSSFWMFFLGLAGPAVMITGPIGAYSIIFGVPNWIIDTFG